MITFNGHRLKDHFDKILDVRRDILPPRSIHSLEVPGRSGSYLSHVRRESRIIEVDVFMIDRSFEALRSRIRQVAAILDVDQPSPLVINDEPDLVWYAVLMDDTELEEVIYTGRTTLRFFVPDPYAYGQSHEQVITTNEVSSDTRTQADWSQGTLDGVVATEYGLELAKEGQDLVESADWASGVHDGTRVTDTGRLALDFSTNAPVDRTLSERDNGWAGGINSGTKVDGSNLVMNNFPAWSYTDNMRDYKATGWDPRIGPEKVGQTANTTRMVSYIGTDDAVALVKETGSATIRTLDIFYRLIPPSGSKYKPGSPIRTKLVLSLNTRWPTDGSRWASFQFYLRPSPSPDGKEYMWYRCVITRMPTSTSNGNMDLYINGQYYKSISGMATTLNPRVQFIIGSDEQGHFNIGEVKWASTALHQKVSSYPFPLSGQRISPEYDLSGLGEYSGSTLTYDWTNQFVYETDDYGQQVDVEIDVRKNGGWTGYRKITSGSSIPQLSEGESLEGVRIRFRATLRSYDYYMSPILQDIRVTVTGFISQYNTIGTWTSPPIPLDQVKTATEAELLCDFEEIAGTEVSSEIAIERDGVMGDWMPHMAGPIPELIGVDLTGVRLFHRIHLSTTDTGISPRVNSVSYIFMSKYKTEGERISPGLPLGEMNPAGDSFVYWRLDEETVDRGEVEVYFQIVDEGVQPNPSGWIRVPENNGPFPGIYGEVLTGKVLYTRQILRTDESGSDSPLLQQLFFWIAETARNQIEYNGTAPGYPRFEIEIVHDSIFQLRIVHLETGDFVLIEDNFRPGDVIVVDHERNSVTMNGGYRMDQLNMNSRFFTLQPGMNSFGVTPRGAKVTVSWRERWK